MTALTKLDSETHKRAQKKERVNFRVSREVKHTLVRAAEITGRSLSDFIADSAFNAALQAIEGVERMRLADEDRAVFMAALANPPEPNAALKSAAAWYKELAE